MTSFLFFEVLSYETALPVTVSVWHVRSVRPIREAGVDEENITRIEFTNGDALDCSDSVPMVLRRIEESLQPIASWLATTELR